MLSLLAFALGLLAAGCRGDARPDGTWRPAAAKQPTVAEPSSVRSDSSTPTHAPESGAPQLRLLTYNVLASPVFLELRMKALFALLRESNADVIALQEVASWMVEPLAQQDWVKRNYHLTTRGGAPFAPGGQLILARYPILSTSAQVLVGDQRRTVLLADVRIAGRLLRVATSHLESFLDDGPVRAQQLDAIFGLLEGADDAVLMGDLNFADGAEPETSRLDRRYLDVWRTLRPGDPGFTWNNEQNPIARIGAFAGEPSRRLDRILLRSSYWRPTSIAIVGNHSAGSRQLRYRERAMIEPRERQRPDAGEPTIEIFPSDHYGLIAVLER